MTTAASLKTKTVKELGKLAQKLSIAGWQGLRKDDLIKAIVKATKAAAKPKPAARKKATASKAKTAKPSAKKAVKKKTTATATKAVKKKTATTTQNAAAKKKPATVKPKARKSSTKKTATVKAKAASSATKSKGKTATKPAVKKTTKAAKKPTTPRTAASPKATKTAAKPKPSPADTKAKSKPKAAPSESNANKSVVSKAPSTANTTPPSNGKSAAESSAKPQGRIQSPPIRVELPTNTSPRVLKKIHTAQSNRERLRDLTSPNRNGSAPTRDRIALLVRDPYWLQAHWELTRATVERGQIALAEQWHTAIPIVRLLEIEDVSTTNTAERILKDIEIHGEVTDWYIDVPAPNTAYRVAIGYKTATGRFHVLARSNKVVTPSPGTSDSIDENWSDIAENCEKIFAMSGGYDSENPDGDLRELFEERLRRPMGSPVVTRFGMGAEGLLNRKRNFKFDVDAEMIIYGATQPNAYVTLAGEPVKLRPDGTFTVRLSMPDRRQVIPVVASSSDGVEQHTTVLAVERNTKVMEPLIKESSE